MLLFRFKGVPVKLGWSWLVIFGLVFWSLESTLFPATYPGRSETTYLVMSGVATVLFFASILVHELSHTYQSLREGVAVREISLWLFGGVSRADEPLPGPGAELRVVGAGPLASAVLAALFLALAAGAQALGLSDAWYGVLDYLGRINLLLLVFNIVPAIPLDGGRLLHALLWRRTGDAATATLKAAVAGRAFAWLLIVLGLMSLVATSSMNGLWFLVLGWFLLQAVQQEVLGARVVRAFSGLRVRDLMTTSLSTVPPGMSIAEFADLLGRWPSHPAYPVLDDGRFVGMLLLRRAGEVPLETRADVHVGDVMLEAEYVPVLHPDDLVATVAPRLDHQPGRAVVLGGRTEQDVVGLLSTSDLARALEVRPGPPPPRRPGRPRVW